MTLRLRIVNSPEHVERLRSQILNLRVADPALTVVLEETRDFLDAIEPLILRTAPANPARQQELFVRLAACVDVLAVAGVITWD